MCRSNRPDLSSIDCMDGYSGIVDQKQQVSSYIIKRRPWAVVSTEWHIITFHKLGWKHPSEEVDNSVAALLQIYFSMCVPKIMEI